MTLDESRFWQHLRIKAALSLSTEEAAELRKDSVSPALYTPAKVTQGGSPSAEEAIETLRTQTQAMREAIERGEVRMPQMPRK